MVQGGVIEPITEATGLCAPMAPLPKKNGAMFLCRFETAE